MMANPHAYLENRAKTAAFIGIGFAILSGFTGPGLVLLAGICLALSAWQGLKYEKLTRRDRLSGTMEGTKI